VRTHPLDQRLVDRRRIPDEVACVQERCLLALVEPIGALEVEELVVVLLGGRFLSTRERPLRASVVAVDCLGDIHPTELL
jgi:hypothetical protein